MTTITTGDQLPLATIREFVRRRHHTQRAEIGIVLQVRSICRRHAKQLEDGLADLKDANAIYRALEKQDFSLHPRAEEIHLSAFPLLEALIGLRAARKTYEKELQRLASTLPIYEWVSGVKGVGALLLGRILGETGDLSNYPNHRHVWKRMGLAVMEDGRQRKIRGPASIAHGYSPERRSLMWVVGDCIIRAGKDSVYRRVYDERKEYEIKKAEESGLTVRPSAKIPSALAEEFRSEGHVHLRAKRYMEKAFLKDLWVRWNALHTPGFAETVGGRGLHS